MRRLSFVIAMFVYWRPWARGRPGEASSRQPPPSRLSININTAPPPSSKLPGIGARTLKPSSTTARRTAGSRRSRIDECEGYRRRAS